MNLAFERLESRVLLAVNVTKKGSTLLVEFDGGGDPDVTLTGTALGNITVTNANTGDGPYEGIKNIKIVGGAGADEIDLIDIRIAGNVTADMKGGDDDIDIEGALTDIGGNIKAKMGDGNDRFEIDADADHGPIKIGKNITVDLGSSSGGSDFFELYGADGAQDITVGGGVTVKQKDGASEIDLDSVNIAKNVKIDLGDGDDEVDIGRSTIDATQAVTVQKSMTIKTGDGDDVVTFGEDGGGDGTVAITKNLTIDLGNATVVDQLVMNFTDAAGGDVFTVGGNVSIKGKAGVQDLDLDGFAVTGNVKVNLGDGNDSVRVNQAGGDIVATIGKNLDVKLGDGEDDELFAERLTITGKAKIDGGKGASDEAADTDPLSVTAANFSTKNFEVGNLSVIV